MPPIPSLRFGRCTRSMGSIRCEIGFALGAAATEVRSLSHPTRVYPSWASRTVEVGYIRLRWERGGVRGYGLSLGLNPSPGATRRPLPLGEVRHRLPRGRIHAR